MKKMSSVVAFLSSAIPGLFNKKSVEALVLADKISYDAAAEAMSAIDRAATSSESSSVENNAGEVTKAELSHMQGKDAIEAQYRDIKFEAMLQAVKHDDTLLFTEFTNLENALKRVKSEIVAKEENNFTPTRMMLRDGSVKDLTRLQDIYEHLVERYGYEEATKCPIMRIRKLTPRECFRLMDVDDKYIDAIDAYTFEDDDYEKDCLGKEIINTETGKRQKHRIGTKISDSKKYQLAGNSIVVNCMYHIFDNLFVHPTFSDALMDGVKIDDNGQLSLF